MTSWMKNQLTELYNAVSVPVVATQDALIERLQSVRETASSLNNNGGEYGIWAIDIEDIVEKEAEEEYEEEYKEEYE